MSSSDNQNDSQGKQSRFAKLVIKLNNWRRGRRVLGMNPDDVLLLLPRCIQSSECRENLTRNIYNCKRCGNCRMKNLVELIEELGIPAYVATGGRIALAKVLEDRVKGVVAVACELELKAGILSSPKPVLGIINIRPKGPCVETDVNLEEVREAIRKLTGI